MPNHEQHRGELIVEDYREQHGQVTGTAYVRAGGVLLVHGQLAGGLIVEEGGRAIVHGQCCRNIVNHGSMQVYGQVVGRIIGNPPENVLEPNQVLGNDLEVPFRGTSSSWSTSFTI